MKKGEYSCLFMQSEINTIKKGRVKDIINVSSLAKLDEKYPVKILPLIKDYDFHFTDVHMSTPGWPIAEIYSAGKTLDELLELDNQIRKLVYKLA
jgi:hypothetical protein